jgi:N-hydroxyarylamine O-acetyltransferase
MDIKAYLNRIHYRGSLDPTLNTLHDLHRAHLLAVPFENLSISLGQPIVLDEAALFEKIVTHRRGGFCYELNGLFAALLRALGFDVTLLSARVASEEGRAVPEFDHLALQVQLDQPWLADVGFGDGFQSPLHLDRRDEQMQEGNSYRLADEGASGGSDIVLQRRIASADWEEQYRFTLQPRQFGDFAGMCCYHQTSPESIFTRKRICTLATPTGRVTLSDMRLIMTEHGQRTQRLLSSEAVYRAALHEYFGIVVYP